MTGPLLFACPVSSQYIAHFVVDPSRRRFNGSPECRRTDLPGVEGEMVRYAVVGGLPKGPLRIREGVLLGDVLAQICCLRRIHDSKRRETLVSCIQIFITGTVDVIEHEMSDLQSGSPGQGKHGTCTG